MYESKKKISPKILILNLANKLAQKFKLRGLRNAAGKEEMSKTFFEIQKVLVSPSKFKKQNSDSIKEYFEKDLPELLTV